MSQAPDPRMVVGATIWAKGSIVMSAYIEQIRTQDQVLQRRFAHIPGASLASSYDDFIEVLEQYAITLDQRYKTVQTGRRSANQGQRGTTANTGLGNGRGKGGRGYGRDCRGNRNNNGEGTEWLPPRKFPISMID